MPDLEDTICEKFIPINFLMEDELNNEFAWILCCQWNHVYENVENVAEVFLFTLPQI